MAFKSYCRGIKTHDVSISIDEITTAADNTNKYLVKLDALFSEIGFNLFTILGQRNISGVIGEIFSRFLVMGNDLLESNPHPDGRPDVLCVPNNKIKDYLQTCYRSIDGKEIPMRSMLAPFKYGGIEIKCTIGDPVSGYKRLIKENASVNDFYIGFPRIDYIQNLNWWAHHTKSSHLLGLYYDYSKAHSGAPQIMAGFFGVLTTDDWTKVSTGNVENKKTSNTSLNKTGKDIMKQNPIFVVDNQVYISALRKIRVSI